MSRYHYFEFAGSTREDKLAFLDAKDEAGYDYVEGLEGKVHYERVPVPRILPHQSGSDQLQALPRSILFRKR